MEIHIDSVIFFPDHDIHARRYRGGIRIQFRDGLDETDLLIGTPNPKINFTDRSERRRPNMVIRKLLIGLCSLVYVDRFIPMQRDTAY